MLAEVCSFSLGSLKNTLSILSALQKNSKKKSKGDHRVIAKLIFLCLSSVCVCACVRVRVCARWKKPAHKLPELQVRAAEQLRASRGSLRAPYQGRPDLGLLLAHQLCAPPDPRLHVPHPQLRAPAEPGSRACQDRPEGSPHQPCSSAPSESRDR